MVSFRRDYGMFTDGKSRDELLGIKEDEKLTAFKKMFDESVCNVGVRR